ncbi:Bloom syndrome protein homolog [Seminavis robusta]|uniref:DNA 3'-5' helicase n=1 Tax=Seminavis robusta TaxID=568900 RepID=A0A9N8EZB7_9STRA|nr:Bloom syndrome protein homolog [Seminavis robusta]|eukprot:Sro2203_g318940.1 Bloom syndrome protein homolog (904) ;mRNA; r:4169-7535
MSSIQGNLAKIRALEKHREEQRERMNELLEKKKNIDVEIKELEFILEQMDENLESLEEQCIALQVPQQQRQQDVEKEPPRNSNGNRTSREDLLSSTQGLTLIHSDEQLTDPLTQPLAPPSRNSGAPRVSLDAPPRHDDYSPIEDDNEDGGKATHLGTSIASAATSRVSFEQLQITNIPPKKKKPVPKGSGTLDHFLAPTSKPAALPTPPSSGPREASANRNATVNPASAHASTKQYSHSNFPWSAHIKELLQNSFRIKQFRQHQEEVINCTLSGKDVFVLMRTGGGKSLTYQLPALLEGRGPSRKVTLVISPLLSLIKDQEDQMNQFAPGSAVSFTSNLPGGQAEHTRRWNQVRDPQSGVCLILVTPEKVHKSNKLKSELQKLYQQNRLGRFVVDEAHCSSNWGHDFRTDYGKLGILRATFKEVPILAVTATASERVRHDVCDILQISRQCCFFRSSADRPNLKYQVRVKGSASECLDNMAAFIHDKHPGEPGIIYTLSRKDADTVADELCDRGIVAESYHSDVNPTKKDMIHQSWMRNDTQVVVATIAFGLGINHANVRFVLHHSISKTLEAYYQESGRAGRDGNPADCVLYFNPKDAIRMIQLMHGEGNAAQGFFWQMVRYAQEGSGDSVCRSVILSALGEDAVDLETARRKDQETGTALVERRDVGKHAKTVTEVLNSKLNQGEHVSMSSLVKDWRAKGDNALPCVQENPPAPELSPDDCERIIIGLLVERVFQTRVFFNAYGSNVYFELGQYGRNMLSSRDPHVTLAFPARSAGKKSTGTAKKAARKDKDGWITKKASKKPAKGTTNTKKKATTKKSTTRKRKQSTTSKGRAPKKTKPNASNEVIELSSSDDESAVEMKPSAVVSSRVSLPRAARGSTAAASIWEDSPDNSDGECEFDG